MQIDDVRTVLGIVRAFALASQAIALLIGYAVFGAALPLQPMLLVCLCYGAWCGFAMWRWHRAATAGIAANEDALTAELAVDLVAFSALLYFMGGWTNPFTPVLLIPLSVAGAVLAWPRALLVLGLALIAYAALVRWHWPMPSVQQRFGGDFNLHVMGMWVGFVLAALVVVAAVAALRKVLQDERAALAAEREARLRDEQLVAIGALAASAAHELGTPLGTARLLAEELELDLAGTAAIRARELGAQLDAAAQRLRILVRGALHDDSAAPDDLSAFLDRLLERFTVLRPDVEVRLRRQPLPDVPVGDLRLLESGLLGLLLNGADAHAPGVTPQLELSQHVVGDELVLAIRDFGRGLAVTDPRRLGIATSGAAATPGLGVGWVISSATFERHDGRAHIDIAGPGTRVTVRLPLAKLRRADTP